MSTKVSLTPELERFARECVAEGRYNDVSEVVRSAMRLLQEYEEQRRQFEESLDKATEESDREGWSTIEEVAADMDAVIAKYSR